MQWLGPDGRRNDAAGPAPGASLGNHHFLSSLMWDLLIVGSDCFDQVGKQDQ
jgi:hypothetical protein